LKGFGRWGERSHFLFASFNLTKMVMWGAANVVGAYPPTEEEIEKM
jgi:hypothetical protein